MRARAGWVAVLTGCWGTAASSPTHQARNPPGVALASSGAVVRVALGGAEA